MALDGIWKMIPAYGWFFKRPGVPEDGDLTFEIRGAPVGGIKRVDGTDIYRRPIILKAVIGEASAQDSAVRTQIRDAYRFKAVADAAAAGVPFDATAWGQAWDARLDGFVCTSFYAPDDEDITPQGWEVWCTENIGGTSLSYRVPLSLDMLDPLTHPIPGININTIEIPPGTPYNPAPSYAKGQPGGIPELDGEGRVPLYQLPIEQLGSPGGGTGVSSWNQITQLLGFPATFPPSPHEHTASHITDFREATQDAIAELLSGTSGVTLNYDDDANTLTITGGGTGGDVNAEDVRDIIGVALLGAGLINIAVNDAGDTITISTNATANSTDAFLRARGNHTGVHPVDSLPSYMRIGYVNYSAGALPAGSAGIELWHVLNAPADATAVPAWVQPRGILYRSGS